MGCQNRLMPDRMEAVEMVKEMAVKGMSTVRIRTALEKQGLGGVLDRVEIEALVVEARAAGNLIPKPPSKFLPRMVGVAAILMGMGGVFLGGSVGRYSPGGFGFWAVVLGIVLIVKPCWSNEDVK